MRYATISRELLPLLIRALTAPEPRPAGAAAVDRPRTPTEDRLVAAASPLRGGPRHRFRRPMFYATGAPAAVLAAA
ncbi:hypothetical protein GCM10009760_53270 [Kitasatospora kazusensis]|uniref:Uncharacterized protein n=1 Tax=Kitasatospora kazusensis TaxID=407974 RepID=A0ABN3A6F2_9ACTN